MRGPPFAGSGVVRPFSNILVATDFTDAARHAVERALRLPLADGASIAVFHAVHPTSLPLAAAELERAAEQHLEAQAMRADEIARSLGRRVEVTTGLSVGKPSRAVVAEARDRGCELIVVGRHGTRSLREQLIGSTAQRVLRHSEVPVLVVTALHGDGYVHPVIALDLEGDCARILDEALRLSGSAKSVRVVHSLHLAFEDLLPVGMAQREAEELARQAQDSLARLIAERGEGQRLRVEIYRGDPRLTVLGATAQKNADLLVVGTHGRAGLARAVLGSVAEWLIGNVTCDVLAVPLARVRAA